MNNQNIISNKFILFWTTSFSYKMTELIQEMKQTTYRFKVRGQDLERVINSKLGRACACHTIAFKEKTV